MFTRTYSYKSLLSKEDLKSRLRGDHVNIHDLDFEVMDKNEYLRIVPHAEQLDEIKTLPITKVEFIESGNETNVKIISKMRQMDIGGPMLMIILCSLLLVASAGLFVFHEYFFGWLVMAISIISFIAFRVKLEKSYFDYVRKVREHIQAKTA